MYCFKFSVRAWDETDAKTYISQGLGLAESYANAAAQLEEYFKDSLIEITCLCLFEEEHLIFLPKEAVDTYTKTLFPSIEFSEEEKED